MSTDLQAPQTTQAQAAPSGGSGKKVFGIVCLTCLGCSVLAILGAAFMFSGIITMMKGSEPYKVSLERARMNSAVTTLIGEPLAEPFMVMGNINIQNDDGEADLNYTLTGPHGSGTVRVKGTKRSGVWTYSEMEIQIGEQRIPLAH